MTEYYRQQQASPLSTSSPPSHAHTDAGTFSPTHIQPRAPRDATQAGPRSSVCTRVRSPGAVRDSHDTTTPLHIQVATTRNTGHSPPLHIPRQHQPRLHGAPYTANAHMAGGYPANQVYGAPWDPQVLTDPRYLPAHGSAPTAYTHLPTYTPLCHTPPLSSPADAVNGFANAASCAHVPPCMPGEPIETHRDGEVLVYGAEGCNLFVFYLPNDMSNVGLYNLFSPFGTVLSVRIIVDKGTGRSRGFGFVSFETPEAAEAAIHARNGFKIGPKMLKVMHKRTKEQKAKAKETMEASTSSESSVVKPTSPPRPPGPAEETSEQEEQGATEVQERDAWGVEAEERNGGGFDVATETDSGREEVQGAGELPSKQQPRQQQQQHQPEQQSSQRKQAKQQRQEKQQRLGEEVVVKRGEGGADTATEQKHHELVVGSEGSIEEEGEEEADAVGDYLHGTEPAGGSEGGGAVAGDSGRDGSPARRPQASAAAHADTEGSAGDSHTPSPSPTPTPSPSHTHTTSKRHTPHGSRPVLTAQTSLPQYSESRLPFTRAHSDPYPSTNTAYYYSVRQSYPPTDVHYTQARVDAYGYACGGDAAGGYGATHGPYQLQQQHHAGGNAHDNRYSVGTAVTDTERAKVGDFPHPPLHPRAHTSYTPSSAFPPDTYQRQHSYGHPYTRGTHYPQHADRGQHAHAHAWQGGQWQPYQQQYYQPPMAQGWAPGPATGDHYVLAGSTYHPPPLPPPHPHQHQHYYAHQPYQHHPPPHHIPTTQPPHPPNPHPHPHAPTDVRWSHTKRGPWRHDERPPSSCSSTSSTSSSPSHVTTASTSPSPSPPCCVRTQLCRVKESVDDDHRQRHEQEGDGGQHQQQHHTD